MIETMQDYAALARKCTLLGQVLLTPDVSSIAIPEDSDSGLDGLRDELRLAQGVPEPAAIEYSRLFISPLGAVCPPWQSVHSSEPRLMGPAHHNAMAWFREFGIEPALPNEPADHLGLQLVFFAELLNTDEPDETLGRFFEEQLQWGQALAEKLIENARHPLYLSLGRELKALFSLIKDN